MNSVVPCSYLFIIFKTSSSSIYHLCITSKLYLLFFNSKEFLCAINGHVMKNPVKVRSSGLVFEEATIDLWLNTRGAVCPITNTYLDRSDLLADDELRNRYVYVCMHVSVYMCMDVYLYAFMCVCMGACMYVYMYVCMYVYMYVLMSMHVCLYVCMCMYGCMYACMDVCMCVYVCMYVYMCVSMYVCMFVCMYLCVYIVILCMIRCCRGRQFYHSVMMMLLRTQLSIF